MKTTLKLTTLAVLLVTTAPAFAGHDNDASNPTSIDRTAVTKDWDAENAYWGKEYSNRPYYVRGRSYTVYEPAYQYGNELYYEYPDRRYEDLNQVELRTRWHRVHGTSGLTWEEAQAATRDAYNRKHGGIPSRAPNDASAAKR